MFDTNDVYNDAVRGSTIHIENDTGSKKNLIGTKVVVTLVLIGGAYVGLNYYSSTAIVDKTLTAKKELMAKAQVKPEIQAETKIAIKPEIQVVEKLDNSEAEYLSALRGIESELIAEKEETILDTSIQMNLSSAMSDIMEDNTLADNTNYTKELRKEIDTDLKEEIDTEVDVVVDNSNNEESRTVIVKKGDTLQGISNKFYGDAMNYKRIIASNDNLNSNDTIYVGQTILLPY